MAHADGNQHAHIATAIQAAPTMRCAIAPAGPTPNVDAATPRAPRLMTSPIAIPISTVPRASLAELRRSDSSTLL